VRGRRREDVDATRDELQYGLRVSTNQQGASAVLVHHRIGESRAGDGQVEAPLTSRSVYWIASAEPMPRVQDERGIPIPDRALDLKVKDYRRTLAKLRADRDGHRRRVGSGTTPLPCSRSPRAAITLASAPASPPCSSSSW